jgi:hypothetical protein
MPLFSNSTFRNWLVRDRFLLLGQEAKGRSLDPNQSSFGQLFDAEDSAVTARGHGADLDLSPKDRVSVMHESVSKVSVIGKGSKRARMRASGLFRIPVTMIIAVVVMMVGSASAAASPAVGSAPSVAWAIQSVAQPTNLAAGDNARCERPIPVCDQYTLSVTNVGSLDSSGTVTVTDTLPPGITTAATPTGHEGGSWSCTPEGAGQTALTCRSKTPVGALTQADTIFVPVHISPSASGLLVNEMQVSGGVAKCGELGNPPCPVSSANAPTMIGAPPPSFAPLGLSASVLGAAGALDTQAGNHPAGLTTSFGLPSVNAANGEGQILSFPVEDVRQVIVDLPAGLVGDPQAAPACSLNDLSNTGFGGAGCSPATQVGSLELIETPTGPQSGSEVDLPIYNIVAEHGHPAEFGVFDPALQRAQLMYGGIRSGSDYGLRVISVPLTRFISITGVSATFFGNPALRDHSPNSPVAFFTNPSDCLASSFKTVIHADSWQHPGSFNPDGTPNFTDPNWKTSPEPAISPPVSGCESLLFTPEIEAKPDTTQANSPAGFNFDLRIPQNADPNGLATPPLKDVTVTLPQGIAVSPSSADGLQGCADEQIALSSTSPGTCPAGSQIGTVKIHTPVLANPLEGQVFLGNPQCNPCTDAKGDAQSGRMLRLLIQVNDPQTGIVIKLSGTTSADPATGQLTASFTNNPQLPFDDLKLQLKGGSRAPLTTPSTCGTYTTTSDLKPWSSPFTPDATPSSSFEITRCGSPSQFAPTFTAGSVNNQAGAYSPFALSFSRQDTDQQFSGLSATLPPGLLAKLAGVPLCSDANANAGTCPAASQVGSVTTGAGPGSHPFFLSGQVFLTGPYKGAPYGLVVEVPAVAGPFNLGTVVVRQSLHVDPHTAQASVVSDPFPSILDGIPLQVRTVSVTIDRSGFTFNPTSCEPMQIAGTLTSLGGLIAPASSRFQAAGCANLPFKPSFTVSTQGKTSKANGASLVVKVAQNPGEANIHKVNLQLPLALPSRLTTLQKACTASQFESNPAGCPEGSFVGTATAHTPVLAVPLTGPAILDVVFVLQGEGIRIDLVGNTDIKKGITFSRFETVPDAPISSFETNLPEGPHSALAAFGNLCSQSLTMPTTITGQNGAQVTQSTSIAVTGCGKPSIKITKAKIKGNTVLVTVTTSQPGTVTVSGSGLKTIKKTLAAGAHQLKLSLTKNGRTARKHHKKTKVKASVKDSNGSSSKTMTLKL